jgi:hypothetical protein
VSRDEPRRRDWWLIGCAVLAVALAASTAAAIASDESMARATYVAPGQPAVTPTPPPPLSPISEAEPAARPHPDGVPVSKRSR